MAAKLTRLTHRIAIQLHLMSGRELYHLQFSLRAASLETCGYIIVYYVVKVMLSLCLSTTHAVPIG
jgi:hypothetical protein